MEIKDINDCNGFLKFCRITPAEIIENFKTRDWVRLFERIEQVYRAERKAGGGIRNRSDFVDKYEREFKRLYDHYRLEPEYVAEIKEMAVQSAKHLSETCPDIEKDLQNITLERDAKVKRRLAENILKNIYNSVCKSRFSKIMMRPGISINSGRANSKSIGFLLSGHYLPGLHRISIYNKPYSGVATLAHEIYHSLQGIGIHSFLLKKECIAGSCGNADLTRLNRYNAKYYFGNGRAYERQPLEYTARLFGAFYERTLNHNIGLTRWHLTSIKSVKMIFRDFNLIPSEIKFDGCNRKIQIFFDDARPETLALASGINNKYLRGQKVLADDKFCIRMPSDFATIRRCVLAHRSNLKTCRQLKSYKAFFEHEFPEISRNYPVLIERKEEAVRQRIIGERRLDNSLRMPGIFKNLKDFIFEH